jgi:hypothetical protein
VVLVAGAVMGAVRPAAAAQTVAAARARGAITHAPVTAAQQATAITLVVLVAGAVMGAVRPAAAAQTVTAARARGAITHAPVTAAQQATRKRRQQTTEGWLMGCRGGMCFIHRAAHQVGPDGLGTRHQGGAIVALGHPITGHQGSRCCGGQVLVQELAGGSTSRQQLGLSGGKGTSCHGLVVWGEQERQRKQWQGGGKRANQALCQYRWITE